MNKFQRGFTLLELLVVISIIGILIALGVVSYTSAQRNGRDAKRQSDLSGVKKALEQYYALNSGYPSEADCDAADITDFLPEGLPSDPKPGHTAYSYTCTADDYCICALLEQTGKGNATDASCTYGTGDYFCVENVQ